MGHRAALRPEDEERPGPWLAGLATGDDAVVARSKLRPPRNRTERGRPAQGLALVPGVARQLHPARPEDELGEARAIEARRGAPTPQVGHAEQDLELGPPRGQG